MGFFPSMRAWRRPRRTRPALLVGAVAAVVAVAVSACEPHGQGISAVDVGVTTDKVSTEALERGGITVQWLTCTADLKSDPTAGSSATPDTDASVDCRGRTGDLRDLTVTGTVTYVREGRCVRGDLTAAVDGHQVFRANLIGVCGS
jgi:hypothetical protein